MSTPSFDPRKQWVYGYDTFGNEDLPDHLLRISAFHAHAAITKAEKGEPTDWLEAAIHAGGAVEILAKYKLALVNPVLIVDMKSTQSHGLLHVLGEDIGDTKEAQKKRRVKTRTPDDCFVLVSLVSGKTLSRDDLTTVLEVRNSAIHMGLVDRVELQESLRSMVRVIDSIIEISEVSRSKYWGSQIALIDRLSSRGEFQKVLKGKLDAAREIAKTLVPQDLDQVGEDLSRNSETGFDLEEYPEGTSYWFAEKCPVCSRVGTTFCTRWISDPEETFDGESFVEEFAKGTAFRCGSCQLELGEREMLELKVGGTRNLGYRAATEDEMSSYNDHLADLYQEHLEHQAEIRRGR